MVRMIYADPKARLGQLVMLGVTGTAAGLVGLLFNFGGKPGLVHIGLLMLVGGLVWQVWEGAGWARWALACLFLLAALLAASVPFLAESSTDGVSWCVGVAAACVACAAGLGSPWVRHFQTATPPS